MDVSDVVCYLLLCLSQGSTHAPSRLNQFFQKKASNFLIFPGVDVSLPWAT